MQAEIPSAGRSVAIVPRQQARHALPEQPHRIRRTGHRRAAVDDRRGREIPAAARFQPVRVRYHKDDVARIEVAAEQLPQFADYGLRREVIEYFKRLGFKYVAIDLKGFRSGSMNAVLLKDKPQGL